MKTKREEGVREPVPREPILMGSVVREPVLCDVGARAEAACAEMASIHLYLSGSLLMPQFFLLSTQKI